MLINDHFKTTSFISLIHWWFWFDHTRTSILIGYESFFGTQRLDLKNLFSACFDIHILET